MPGSYDMVVIGSGPGGYVAAIRAAQLGMKTAVRRAGDAIGGRCLNEACIPAKAMLRAADVLTEVRDGAEFGISADDVSFDIAGAGKHRDKVVKTLTGGVGGPLQEAQDRGARGSRRARRRAAGWRSATTESRRRRSCSRPARWRCRSPAPSFGGRVIDTAGAWLMNEQPARLAVVGAGASGAEIASAFGRFGTEVVLIEMLDQILPAEDPEIAKVVASEFRRQNIKVVDRDAAWRR